MTYYQCNTCGTIFTEDEADHVFRNGNPAYMICPKCNSINFEELRGESDSAGSHKPGSGGSTPPPATK